MKILFTGGGTGGHIFPIIAVAREIRRIYPKNDLELFYVGPKDDFASILLTQEGIKTKTIIAGKIRRYLGIGAILQNFVDVLFKTPIGLIQAFFYIFFLAPDFVFSKGGYGSLPVVFCAWIFQTPIFLHESDLTPGLSNRIAERFSLQVFTSFPKTEYFSLNKIILVGNPIRKEILAGSEEEARNLFKLKGKKPVIFVLGGSQGAQRINDVILTILPQLLQNFELIHQTGSKNFKGVRAEAKVAISSYRFLKDKNEQSNDLEKYYHIFPFLKERELKHAYRVSDLIISRAGSGSIFEIAALGKPSILIPLPEAAQNHQIKNAYTYASKGAAIVIEEANLTPHFFLEKLKYLFSHKELLEKMEEKAKEFSKPKSARIIAAYIVEYLTGTSAIDPLYNEK